MEHSLAGVATSSKKAQCTMRAISTITNSTVREQSFFQTETSTWDNLKMGSATETVSAATATVVSTQESGVMVSLTDKARWSSQLKSTLE